MKLKVFSGSSSGNNLHSRETRFDVGWEDSLERRNAATHSVMHMSLMD